MIICSHCSTVNHPDNVVCSHCGSPLAPDPALEGDPFIGRTVGGRFKLDTIVGSGEIGMVYRGSDARSGAPVAVKIVHPDVASTLGDALLQAASVLAKLRHAKIATVLGAARSSDGTTFIVTEFLQGETLKNLLERNGPLGPRRTADILFQLCSALAPIHRAGRPHANLKPENVFLVERPDGSDFVKIVDAGSPELFGVHATATGEIIVGTPKYFSPEQAMGRDVGLGSDQFTLGIIGYQLLTGALPFFGATPDQLLSAIANGEPTPVGKRTTGVQLPDKLEHVIHRCLEKEPSRRYPDLRGLATDLASVIKTTQPAAPKPKRARFGAGVSASTVVASPDLLASMRLDAEEDDDEATVMRNLPVDIEAAMRDAVGPAPQLFAEPEPPQAIPAPLMFTGALDQDEVMAQLAVASGGAARHRSSRPPAPALDNELNAALAAAAAETSARAMPAPADMPGPGGGFDPFADFGDVDEIELSPVVPARVSNPPPPQRPVAAPTPSPELSNAILDAISEELDDHRPEKRPIASSPLATAADFAALSPEVISQARATTQPGTTPTVTSASTGSSRTAVTVLLTLLVVAVAGGAVWYFVLREPEAPPVQQRRAAPPPKPAAKAAAKLKVPLQIELRSSPEGAEVFDGAKSLGKTPLALTLDEARPYTWKLTLEGHGDQRHTFDPTPVEAGEAPTPVEVTLSKAEAPTAPGSAAASAGGDAPPKQPATEAPKPAVKKPPVKKPPVQKPPVKKPPTRRSTPASKPKTDPKALRDPFGTKAKKLKNPFE